MILAQTSWMGQVLYFGQGQQEALCTMACTTKALQVKGTAHSLLTVVPLGMPAVEYGEFPS